MVTIKGRVILSFVICLCYQISCCFLGSTMPFSDVLMLKSCFWSGQTCSYSFTKHTFLFSDTLITISWLCVIFKKMPFFCQKSNSLLVKLQISKDPPSKRKLICKKIQFHPKISYTFLQNDNFFYIKSQTFVVKIQFYKAANFLTKKIKFSNFQICKLWSKNLYFSS